MASPSLKAESVKNDTPASTTSAKVPTSSITPKVAKAESETTTPANLPTKELPKTQSIPEENMPKLEQAAATPTAK